MLDAAAGLTRYEAEGALSLSLVRHGQLQPETIWQLKAETLTKSGLLSVHRGGESFSQLGGLQSLKAFCRRALRRPTGDSTGVRARGVLLLGVPGTGKSAFAKALGQETGRPTLTLDVGSLMGSLLGPGGPRQSATQAAACKPRCVQVRQAARGGGLPDRLFFSYGHIAITSCVATTYVHFTGLIVFGLVVSTTRPNSIVCMNFTPAFPAPTHGTTEGDALQR